MANLLTADEIELIELLYKDKTPISKIARELNRSSQTIYNHLDRVGLREKEAKNDTEETEQKDYVAQKTLNFDARRQKVTNVRRGDVFYVCKSFEEAEVMAAGRPAVIVSNDRINMTADFVEIVFLTTKEKKPMPTHVTVTATGKQATALCEEIMSVRKNRLREYCNTCPPEEMAMIDKAMAISLALDVNNLSESVNAINPEPKVVCEPNADYQAVVAEKDLYKRMYEELLDKLIKRQ
jgi:mRNA interferase MazF